MIGMAFLIEAGERSVTASVFSRADASAAMKRDVMPVFLFLTRACLLVFDGLYDARPAVAEAFYTFRETLSGSDKVLRSEISPDKSDGRMEASMDEQLPCVRSPKRDLRS